MYRWIYIRKSPFICRKLTVGMHEPIMGEQGELLFGKINVDLGKTNTVKCQVPGRKPGIFPAVRHGYDVGTIQVSPVMIPAFFSLGWWRRTGGISRNPFLHIIIIQLLAPDHSGICLPLNGS